MKHSIQLSFILLTGLVFAGTTGKLAGTVTDAETGDVLPGCNVVVLGTDFGAATDIDGKFFILNLPPGLYDVRAMMIGYAAETRTSVQINIDLTTKLDYRLSVQAIKGEEVTVTAERAAIQFDLTSSEARVSSKQLEALPVNEIWDVINIQSGVTKDAGGGIHIRGGRSREIAYWVDGVSVTDMYDGGISVAIDNNAIQELQVISGTFNAEYGQAMSGIINLVTKDGGINYEGYLSTYSAKYATDDDKLKGNESFSFGDDRNLEGSLSGPVPLFEDRLTFYTFGRYNKNNGWLYGWNVFDKWGRLLLDFDDNGNVIFTPSVTSMTAREKMNTNTKFSFKINDAMKLRYSILTSSEEYQDYNHSAQYSPEGELYRFNNGFNQKLSFTHSLSPKSYYTLDVSEFSKSYEHYAFKNPADTSYVDPYYFLHEKMFLGQSTFKIWGVDRSRFNRSTNTRVGKFDFTSQINSVHQIRLGAEYREHVLKLDSYSIEDSDLTDTLFTARIPGDFVIENTTGNRWTVLDTTLNQYIGWEMSSVTSPDDVFLFDSQAKARSFVDYYNKNIQFGRGNYREKPQEISAYIQDKIEFESLIINIGIRWDWFNPNAVVPANPAEPYMGNPRNAALDSLSIEERKNIHWADYAVYYQGLLPDSAVSLRGETGWWKKTTPQQKISPRLGIAYPITDKGVIHFSFGHFFQIPSFENLFKDPGYKIPEESGKFGIFGNPALKPQKTVMYELGLQQEIVRGVSIDLTGYYRDVRDWVSTGIPVNLGGGSSYFTYINKDYSNVRGVTLNVDRRFSQGYGFNLNYTFQISEGSNSNPDEEFGAVQNNQEPVRAILPLDWDQTHTVNGAFYFGGKAWSLSLLGQFGSGYPYTPTQNTATTQGVSVSTDLPRNSRRKPMTYNLDMNFQYKLPITFVEGQLFVKVFNLLDRRNEINVFSDTGTARETYNIQGTDNENRPNTIAEFYSHPEWFSAPRQIQIGLKFNF